MKKIVTATMLALVMGGAYAQGYVEGAFGPSNLDADCAGTTRCELDSTGFKLVGGYAFNPNFSVEAGYINFGTVEASVYDFVPGFGYQLINGELKSTAFYVGGAVRGEFGSGFAGVARLGLANVETEVKSSITFGSVTTSETKMRALFGLGLEYAITKQLKLTGNLDFTQAANAEDNETATLRLLSIGAKFNF